MRIALDAMGGDHAPDVTVAGAVRAARELRHEIILVGRQPAIEQELARHKPVPKNLTIHHAEEIIEMHEPPVASVRRKKNASINVAVQLVKDRSAAAAISAGNTGAMVCAATLTLGLLPGIERPGIGIVLPGLKGETFVIDVGANIAPRPTHLLQYALMGDAYATHLLGKAHPRVGLLNVGEEETKGTEFIKETHGLLVESPLNFVGNVEGHDLYTGETDVIVCDGFVGNVALKVSESMGDAINHALKRALSISPITRLGAWLARDAFIALRKEIDYAEYGGAPLLGVDGVAIIAHGASSAKAIKNAIRVAIDVVERDVNRHILTAISAWQRPGR